MAANPSLYGLKGQQNIGKKFIKITTMNKKTSTKNMVMDYLQWSTEEYEARLLISIWIWCQKHGCYPSIIQQLFANSLVNKWFMTEYTKCEMQFIKIAEMMPNKIKQLEGHYKSCTSQIQDIYPKPLIDIIKKNRDFSNIYIINTPVYYAN